MDTTIEDGAPIEAPPPPQPQPKQRKGVPQESPEQLSLREWFSSLGIGGNQIKLKLHRSEPKVTQQGRRAGGFLRDYSEMIDEAAIKEEYGGGRFQLQVLKQNEKGSWTYHRQITIEIAGAAKMPIEAPIEEGEVHAPVAAAGSADDPSVVRQALAMAADLTREERQRATEREREARENNRGPDASFIAQMTEPFKLQIETMRQELVESRRMISELSKPKEEGTKTTDRILEKMLEGDNSRIAAIREQHASELRTLRESNEQEKNRLHSFYDKQIDNLKTAHERELRTVQDSATIQRTTLEQSYNARIEGLNGQIRALERELDSNKKELVELRIKKDVPIEEQAMRLMKFKEMMEGFGAGDEEEMPPWMKVAMPVVEGASKFIGNLRPGQMPGQPPMNGAPVPQGVPGQGVPVRKPKPAKPAPAAKPKQQALPEPSMEALNLDIEEVKQALSFAENAGRSDQDPAVFARSARAMVPGQVINFIRLYGVDALIDLYKPADGTFFASQAGMTWLRKVAKVLTEPTE